MGNQAEKLRLKMENKHISTSIGVISGKGGVGKSNFSTNFSFNLLIDIMFIKGKQR